jgi:hypothetical protein
VSRPYGSKNQPLSKGDGRLPGPRGLDAALGSLIGRPVQVEQDAPLGPAERVALLLQRVRQLQAGAAPNPYQTDFCKFAFELVRTKDEAAGGVVRPLPPDPYLYEAADAFFTCPLLLIEKSRRVRMSWWACAFDIWLWAGGQDPRWLNLNTDEPVLMAAQGNRQIILASRKLEDLQGSQWFLEKRIKFILDDLERRNVRDYWPSFPEWTFKTGEIAGSNGSFMTAIASGADQARAAGATLVHAEEIAFWPQARASIGGMLPTLLPAGHLIGITTPQANSFAHELVMDRLEGGDLY